MNTNQKSLSERIPKLIQKLNTHSGLDDNFKNELNTLLSDCSKEISSAENLTNRKLEEERKMLRAIIDNIPDYIFVKDVDRKHLLNNKKVCEELYGGAPEEETLNTTVYDIYDPIAAASYDEDDKHIIETGEPIINRQEMSFTPEGEKKWFLLTKVPLRDVDDQVKGVVGIAKDITESYNQNRAQQLVSEIIQKLHNNEDLNKSLAEVIQTISLTLGFNAGEFWMQGDYNNKLYSAANWSDEDDISTTLFDYPKTFDYGEGLPGTVAQKQKILFWNSEQTGITVPRIDKIKELRLKEVIGIPILIKEKLIGVFLFFSRANMVHQPHLEELLERISLQTGLDIQRKKNAQELNNLFQYSPDLIGIAGSDGCFRKINPAFKRLLGYNDDEILNKPFIDFVHPEDVERTLAQFSENQDGDITEQFENRYRTKNGAWKWIRWHSSEWLYNEEVIFAYGHDITRFKETNFELLKFKNVIERSRDGVTILTLDDGKRYINEVFRDMLGYSNKELQQFVDLAELYTDPLITREVRDALFSGQYWRGDVTVINKSGEPLELFLSGGPVFNDLGEQIAVFGIYTDIRDRKQYEKALQDSIAEKETLLSEIHHRVKNNLAVVAGMMELQLMSEEDDALSSKLSDSINRIKSIATIHEQLYQNKSFSNLNFSESLKQLVSSIFGMMQSEVDISINYKLDDVQISVNQGIPSSLIVNEVITNILKHAFTGRTKGNVVISLTVTGQHIHIQISDDGIGLPANFDPKSEKTLGLKLIDILTEQLKGESRFESGKKGTTFYLSFEKRG